jgi:hypothetical protein
VTQSEETDETDKRKVKERENRSRMYSIESPLRSRHSVGSESEKEKEQQSAEVKARKRQNKQKTPIKRKKRRGSRTRCIVVFEITSFARNINENKKPLPGISTSVNSLSK